MCLLALPAVVNIMSQLPHWNIRALSCAARWVFRPPRLGSDISIRMWESFKYLPHKAFAALEAHKGPLSCVGSCMSHQVGGFLDKIEVFPRISLRNHGKP